jgi:outer membrane protein assembly factor BamB
MSRAATFGSSWPLLMAVAFSPVVGAHLNDDDPPAVANRPFTLVQDAATVYNLEILPDYMGGDGWPVAIQILQEIFDADEDVFVPVTRPGPDGKQIEILTGARAEALRVLTNLPAAGRAAYHSSANPLGKELLAAARKQGDWHLVADVARRYPLTPAGLEAAKLLGMHHLDRGDAPQAARWFRLWQERNPNWQADGIGVYLSWAALLSSGNAAQADDVWQKFQARYPAGLVLDGQKVKLADLKKPWETAKPAAPYPALPWSTTAGNAARTGVAAKVPPVDALHWTVATSPNQAINDLLDDAMRLQENRPQPVMSGNFPIVAGDTIVCRTQTGLVGLAPATGKVIWDRPFERSLDRLLADADSRAVVDHWLGSYLRYHPQVLLENTNLGCLSADSVRVYAVDNMPLVPFVSRAGKKGMALPPYNLAVAEIIQRSQLCALDVATGKIAWEIGLAGGKRFLDKCYFLGPPLPVEGKLYGIAEKGGYLHLYCLEPSSGKLLWKQCLGAPQYGVAQDGGRRLQAVHLSYDQGILICPTNGGAVLAYDLHTSSLLWAHAYRTKTVSNAPKLKGLRPAKELEIEAIPNLRKQLQVTAPVIWQGKVVMAAPDSPAVECLRLADGALLWKAERASDDLFLAGVHKDKVLIVGRNTCRALSVADGKELWQTDIGLPCGQGLFAGEGECYLLPIKTDAKGNAGGIVRLHLGTGKAARLPELPGQPVAGNLLVVNDQLFAQSVTAITSWGPAKQLPRSRRQDAMK